MDSHSSRPESLAYAPEPDATIVVLANLANAKDGFGSRGSFVRCRDRALGAIRGRGTPEQPPM